MDADAQTYGVGLTSFAGGRLGMDPNFGTVSGKRAVLETLLRVWHSPKGSLLTAPDRGVDLRSYLSASLSSASAQFELRAALIDEALKDPRIDRLDVRLSFDARNERLEIAASVGLVDGSGLSFTMLSSAVGIGVFDYLEVAA